MIRKKIDKTVTREIKSELKMKGVTLVTAFTSKNNEDIGLIRITQSGDNMSHYTNSLSLNMSKSDVRSFANELLALADEITKVEME